MRWITVGPADQPGTCIVLHPPAADPGITDDESRTIVEPLHGRLGERDRVPVRVGDLLVADAV